MKRFICLVLALVMCLGVFAACGGNGSEPTNPQNPNNSLAGTYNITMWVSEKEGVSDLFKTQL